ncbi:MAG: hypothetical protein ACLSCV_03960 [Acutalibacteraceae bacterium]
MYESAYCYKISERVLLFAIDNTVKAKLEVILQQLDIQSHTVTEGELGQDVGYLAGFHGFQEKPMSDVVLLRQKGYCACVVCQVNVLTD